MLSAVGGVFGFGARDVITVKVLDRLTRAGNEPAARKLFKAALAVPVMPWESHGPRGCLIGGYADILESDEESLKVVSDFLAKCKGLKPEVESLVVYAKLRMLNSLQRHEEAYEFFSKKAEVLEASPNLHATALAMHLWDAYQAGRMAEVEPLIPEALQVCRRYDEGASTTIMSRSVHNAAGMIYRSLLRFDKAEAHLKESLRTLEDTGMMVLLADTYLQRGELSQARKAFDEAMEAGALPGSEHFYLMTVGQTQEALEALELYKNSSPGIDDPSNVRLRVSALATEALIHLNEENYQKARDILSNCLTREVGDETHAIYSCWLAVSEAGTGSVESASERLEDVLPVGEKFPQNLRLQNTFTDTKRQLLYLSGDYEKVVEMSPSCVEAAPPIGLPKLYYQWGQSLRHLDKADDAKRSFQKATEAVPGTRYAKLAESELQKSQS